MGIYSLKMDLHKLWYDAMEKDPGSTVYGMAYRTFRSIDTNRNGILSQSEFANGMMRLTRNKFTKEDCDSMFNILLKKNCRHMNVDDFIIHFRVDMNSMRLNKVLNIFNSLDIRNAGTLTITDLNCSNHPEVQNGLATSECVATKIIKEILGNKYDYDTNCDIKRYMFIEYYTVLSMSISSDEMFLSVMNNSWSRYIQLLV